MSSVGLSLKGYSIDLADYLGITPLAVYERQRALVRLGVLPLEGKGPNRGVRAAPSAVAAVLIAALFAENLSEIDDRVVRLLNAKPMEMERRLAEHAMQQAHIESAKRQFRNLGSKAVAHAVAQEPAKVLCPITRAANFRNGVAAVLGSEALASEVGAITINRTAQVGIIAARDGRISRFGTVKSKKPRMEVEARFPGELVMEIASDLNVLSKVEEKS
jgi:hypothetical protein